VRRWIWVSLPYATFGLAVADGKVVEAAPYCWGVMRKIGSQDERVVAAWLRERGAVFAEVPEVPRRAWIELPAGSGWGDARMAAVALESLGYHTEEVRATEGVHVRVSGAPLEVPALWVMPPG
jgi:hypothetical protein